MCKGDANRILRIDYAKLGGFIEAGSLSLLISEANQYKLNLSVMIDFCTLISIVAAEMFLPVFPLLSGSANLVIYRPFRVMEGC